VFTKTIIVIVESFTITCPTPTILIEETETIYVTEAPTCIEFTKGPYTKTIIELSCYTTTTTFFIEEECGCTSGWPYATGQGYPPLVCPSGAAAVSHPPVVYTGAVTTITTSKPGPAAAATGKGPILFSSGASQLQAGFLSVVVALIAGLVML